MSYALQPSDRFTADAIQAMAYRYTGETGSTPVQLSPGAEQMVTKPLWAIAAQCLEMAGHKVDMYGNRELIVEQAMQTADHRRHTFYSENEDRRYAAQASAIPVARPGDFPNILSGLVNKMLDTVELDEEYSYPLVSAVIPNGLNDFKPAPIINRSVVEELDEVPDATAFGELGIEEEVLSYLFMRRWGNKCGLTPVMVANDDLGAFSQQLTELAEAWQVTQNRLVIDRFTSGETLLDGYSLFADRPNTGSGTNPALNSNALTGNGAPSDTSWGAMETAYADIGGVATGKRVRGTLNTCFVPTGAYAQEARRTFQTLNQNGLENKVANTTANVGLYRGQVAIVPDSELRIASPTTWYGLRSPTKLSTATVIRAYFNGYGMMGRRERWYDPNNKTMWVSLEGRIAVAVKNWRYAIRNVG